MHAQAERLGSSIRRRSGVPATQPPSDVARALGRPIGLRADIPEAFDGYSVPGRRKLLVRKTGYEAHDEFTVAHELVEQHLSKKLPDTQHESFCDRAAAALMLPQDYFTLATWRASFDLAALRRRHRWASWTTLAWRITECFPGIAACLWVDGQPVERRIRDADCAAVSEAEAVAARHAFRAGFALIGAGAWLARAWYVTGKRKPFAVVTIAVPASA